MYRFVAFVLSLLLLCSAFLLTGAAEAAPAVTLSVAGVTQSHDASAPLPHPEAPAGKVFAGWGGEGVFLPAGATFTPTADTTLTALFVGLSTEGTLRLGTGKGLRFLTRMDRADYTALCSHTAVQYGTVVAPLAYAQAADNSLDPDALTAAGKTKQLVMLATAFYEETDTVLTFAGSVVALKAENYMLDYVGAGYLKVQYTNGQSGRIMAPVSDPVCPYTLADAALSAGNAPTEEQEYLSNLLSGRIVLNYWMSAKPLTLTAAGAHHALPYTAVYSNAEESILLTVRSDSSFRFDQHFCALILDGYTTGAAWNAANLTVRQNGTVLAVKYREYTDPR